MKSRFLTGLIFLNLFVSAQEYAPVSDTINAASWQEAMEKVFGLLPKAHYPTGYLLNKSSFSAKMHYANGALTDSSFNMLEWYFLQNTVHSAYNRPDSITGYLSLDASKNKYVDENNILPWGIIDMTANVIKSDAFTNGALRISDHRLVENTGSLEKIYTTKKLFCVCPLNTEVMTLNPQFIFTQDNMFSNNPNVISEMQVDLDDGLGYRTVSINMPFQASYLEGGFKEFISRFIYLNGDTLYSRSELNVIDNSQVSKLSSQYQPYDEIYTITGGPTVLGDYPSEFTPALDASSYVEVATWYGCGNTNKRLRKPFVLFGGYNPKNGKSLASNGYPSWQNQYEGPIAGIDGWRGPMYETYNGFFTDLSKNAGGGQAFGDNGNRLLDKLRQEGYDVMIVRFHDGIGYLQNNAYLVSLVLKQINNNILSGAYNAHNPGADLDPEAPNYPNTTVTRKARHELVVGGLSAGGLSTRMGLLLMEYEHEKYRCQQTAFKGKGHRTRLWVSIDCENQGSNVPIGAQMFMDFEQSIATYPANNADIANSLICNAALGLLNHSGIATQNTLYNTTNMPYVGNNTWAAGHNNDFDTFFGNLTNITPVGYPANLRGYPNKCYRIGVSQGSAKGIGQLIGSDIKLLNNQSPSTWCVNQGAGASYGMLNFFGAMTTPYRDAKARVLTSWNNNAFTCRFGAAIETFVYSWYINLGHWKYHDNNYINDLNFGTYRNYDEATGSTLPSHIILGSNLPWSDRDPVIAAFNFCNTVDWNDYQHGFSPTVSGLDLHQPNNNALPRLPDLSIIPGNVSGGLNLMQQNNYNIGSNMSPNSDFGFPHLIFPTTHYDHTPYDAIWANTTNNTNYDDNTIHVEDPNPLIGEFLTEEIAPTTLYLSNRTIGGEQYTCGGTLVKEKYYADFEARNSVLVGNQDIYKHNIPKYARVRSAAGDFIIEDGGIVTFRANNYDGYSSVVLGAGFSSKNGSILRAYVYNDPGMCGPFSYSSARQIHHGDQPLTQVKLSRPIITKRAVTQQVKRPVKPGTNLTPAVYPNPTTGSIFYAITGEQSFSYLITDVTGKHLESGILNNLKNNLDLSNYKAGVYFITITSENYKQTDRIILQ